MHSTNKKELDALPNEVQLHIAEYNSLMARSTNMLSYNVVLLAAAITAMAALVINVQQTNIYIIWGLIFGIQILGILSAWIIFENANIVRYLELELKAKLERILYINDFWCYERYISREKQSMFILNAELIGPISYFLYLITCFFILHRPRQYFDWVFYVICILLFVLFSMLMKENYRLKKERAK